MCLKGRELINFRNLTFHISIFLLAIIFSYFKGQIEDSYYKGIHVKVEIWGDLSFEGRIIRIPIKIIECEGADIRGRKALLFVKGDTFPKGRYFLIKGNLKIREGRIYIWTNLRNVSPLNLYSIRDFLVDRYIEASGGRERAGVGISFLFGEPREVLDPSVRGDFLRTGLIHFLVISGLHIGVISLILSFLLPRPHGYILAVIGVCIYMLFIVPSEPPVLRAGFMFLLLILSRLVHRKVNPLNTLLFSASLILFLYPHNLFSFSFWLSFLATLFILLSLKDLKGNTIYKSFFVSLSAFSATSPLIATFSFISPLSVLVSPLLTPIVFVYSFTGILSLITLFTVKPFVDLFNLFGFIFTESVSFLSKFSLLLVPTLSRSEVFFLIFVGILGLYFLKGNYKLLPIAFINCWLFVRSF